MITFFSIRSIILSGKESKDVQKQYLLVDDLIYYLSNVKDDPCMRLFVPRHLKTYVVCLFLLLYVPCQQLWSLRDGKKKKHML